MNKNKNDISKFNFAEIFNDSVTGKTSASGTSGIVCIFVGLLGFISGVMSCYIQCCTWGQDIISQSLVLITIGASLLGLRKIVTIKSFKSNKNDNNTENESI